MKRLTINLPEELHKKLRMKSVQDGTTATEIIVELLKTSMK
jgi:plasmid stability protein